MSRKSDRLAGKSPSRSEESKKDKHGSNKSGEVRKVFDEFQYHDPDSKLTPFSIFSRSRSKCRSVVHFKIAESFYIK